MTLYLVEYNNMEEYEDNYTRTSIVCSTLDRARQYIASNGRCRLLKRPHRSIGTEIEEWRGRYGDIYPDPKFSIYEIEVDEPIKYIRERGDAE